MGWRSKLVFLLVVYFAGFATAIYALAPVPENKKNVQHANSGFTYSALKSDKFAQSFNVEMRKCFDLAKDAAQKAGRFIKQKIDESHIKTSS